MSSTIDTALHQWALDNGYVRLADITEFVRHQSEPNPQQVVEVLTQGQVIDQISNSIKASKAIEVAHAIMDRRSDALAALPDDKVDDLFVGGELTLKDISDALRSVIDHYSRGGSPEVGAPYGKKLLERFGAGGVSSVPKDKYSEFIAAAAEMVK